MSTMEAVEKMNANLCGAFRKEAEDFLAARENTSSGGTSWERIAKLVDLSDKHAKQSGKADKSRFRDLLQDLRKDENAPGAKGV